MTILDEDIVSIDGRWFPYAVSNNREFILASRETDGIQSGFSIASLGRDGDLKVRDFSGKDETEGTTAIMVGISETDNRNLDNIREHLAISGTTYIRLFRTARGTSLERWDLGRDGFRRTRFGLRPSTFKARATALVLDDGVRYMVCSSGINDDSDDGDNTTSIRPEFRIMDPLTGRMDAGSPLPISGRKNFTSGGYNRAANGDGIIAVESVRIGMTTIPQTDRIMPIPQETCVFTIVGNTVHPKEAAVPGDLLGVGDGHVFVFNQNSIRSGLIGIYDGKMNLISEYSTEFIVERIGSGVIEYGLRSPWRANRHVFEGDCVFRMCDGEGLDPSDGEAVCLGYHDDEAYEETLELTTLRHGVADHRRRIRFRTCEHGYIDPRCVHVTGRDGRYAMTIVLDPELVPAERRCAIAMIGDSVESIPVANPYLEDTDMECGLSYWGDSGLACVAPGGRLTLRSGDSIVKTFDLPGDGRFVPVYADSDIAVLRDLDSKSCLVTDWTASIRSDVIFPPDRRIMRIGGRTTPIVTDGKDTFRLSMRGIEKVTGKLVLDAGILEWDHGIAVVRMD